MGEQAGVGVLLLFGAAGRRLPLSGLPRLVALALLGGGDEIEGLLNVVIVSLLPGPCSLVVSGRAVPLAFPARGGAA
jgi:hypothetical protein